MTLPQARSIRRVKRRMTMVETYALGGFLRAYNVLTRELDEELKHEFRISLAQLHALMILNIAPDQRLRLSNLAEKLVFSQSGLTRMVDRLEHSGCIRREADPNDGRVQYVKVTEQGLDKLAKAGTFYAAKARQHFFLKFSREELELMTDFWCRILGTDDPSRILGGPS